MKKALFFLFALALCAQTIAYAQTSRWNSPNRDSLLGEIEWTEFDSVQFWGFDWDAVTILLDRTVRYEKAWEAAGKFSLSPEGYRILYPATGSGEWAIEVGAATNPHIDYAWTFAPGEKGWAIRLETTVKGDVVECTLFALFGNWKTATYGSFTLPNRKIEGEVTTAFYSVDGWKSPITFYF